MGISYISTALEYQTPSEGVLGVAMWFLSSQCPPKTYILSLKTVAPMIMQMSKDWVRTFISFSIQTIIPSKRRPTDIGEQKAHLSATTSYLSISVAHTEPSSHPPIANI